MISPGPNISIRDTSTRRISWSLSVLKLRNEIVAEAYNYLAEAMTSYEWCYVTLRWTLHVFCSHYNTPIADIVTGLRGILPRVQCIPTTTPSNDEICLWHVSDARGTLYPQVQGVLRGKSFVRHRTADSGQKYVACGITSVRYPD